MMVEILKEREPLLTKYIAGQQALGAGERRDEATLPTRPDSPVPLGWVQQRGRGETEEEPQREQPAAQDGEDVSMEEEEEQEARHPSWYCAPRPIKMIAATKLPAPSGNMLASWAPAYLICLRLKSRTLVQTMIQARAR